MHIKNRKTFLWLFVLYIVIMVAFSVIGAVPTGDNTWDKGAKIYFPNREQTVGGAFIIKGSAYSVDNIENIQVKIMPGDIITSVEREKVYHDGKPILTLSTFSVPIVLVAEGEYSASIIVTDSTGTYEFDNLVFASDGTIDINSFDMFSLQHLIALGIVLLGYILILIAYKKFPHNKTKNIIYGLLTAAIVLCDISVKLWLLKNGVFKASYDAFLHMCDISGPLLITLFYIKRSKNKQQLFSLMFIWGVLGAAMALLTPEMRGNVFPSLYFINFFVKHGVIVAGVLIVGVIENYAPKMKHLGFVMGISLIIVAVVYGINRLILNVPPYEPGNYMFLSYPPTGGSALDMLTEIFGPSPNYIIGMVALAVVLYTLMWGIYALIGKVKSANRK